MDFDHNTVRQMVEEDRLSSLPDDLIHKILSTFDTKFVVQTCVLSSRWKFLWTTMTCLNFSSGYFGTSPKFSKFVTNVLKHRNHQIEVSSLKLDFDGAGSQAFVKKIANYAFSHNVQQLTLNSCPKKHYQFPPSLFTSQSLKNFTLCNRPFSYPPCLTPKTPWDFPSLTTLHLSDITLCDNHTEKSKSVDLFSKCVNLKSLTLNMFTVKGVEVFDIITPQLSTLVLIECRRPIAINLIAPQLENLTLMDCSIEYINVPPGVSYLCYKGYRHPPISKKIFHSLNKASICMSMFSPYNAYKEEDALKTIDMLQQIHTAKYLTLSIDIIECLSLFPDLVSHLPSPFSNLISLNIDSSRRDDAYNVKMSNEVRNFFLENSPTATFIMELPEPPPTKAMKQKEARAKKKAQQIEEIETHMKEFQLLIEHGNMIIEKKEKGKAGFENIMAILPMERRIRPLLEKLLKREKAEVEARLSRKLEEAKEVEDRLLSAILNSEEDKRVFKKLLSDHQIRISSCLNTKPPLSSQMPSSSSTSIPAPSTSSINPMS